VHDGVAHQLGDDRRRVVALRKLPAVAGVAEEGAGGVDRPGHGGQVDAAAEPGRAGADERGSLVAGRDHRHGLADPARPQALRGGRVGAEERQPGDRPAAGGRHGRDEHLGGRGPVELQPGDVHQHRFALAEELDQAVQQIRGGRGDDCAARRRHQRAGAVRRPQLDAPHVTHRAAPPDSVDESVPSP
jgi:hypothetical protein